MGQRISESRPGPVSLPGGKTRIGILDLQGAVREHVNLLATAGAEAVRVKWPEELKGLGGLIIPGGESTTIGKLMDHYGFVEPVRDAYRAGMAIYGTCAGLILLAREIEGGGEVGKTQTRLGLMDIVANRNAFGRQRESFEVDVEIPEITGRSAAGERGPFRAVFIRAPYIDRVYGAARTMAIFDGKIVMARQGRLLVSAFHPELTGDTRVHRYFLEMVQGIR